MTDSRYLLTWIIHEYLAALEKTGARPQEDAA